MGYWIQWCTARKGSHKFCLKSKLLLQFVPFDAQLDSSSNGTDGEKTKKLPAERNRYNQKNNSINLYIYILKKNSFNLSGMIQNMYYSFISLLNFPLPHFHWLVEFFISSIAVSLESQIHRLVMVGRYVQNASVSYT